MEFRHYFLFKTSIADPLTFISLWGENIFAKICSIFYKNFYGKSTFRMQCQRHTGKVGPKTRDPGPLKWDLMPGTPI